MEPKKDFDWKKLSFQYIKTPYRFHAHWKDGKWDEGNLVTENTIAIHEGATSIHYGQQCFEGMKAQRSKDGRVFLFRPKENMKRFQDSARRLLMAEVPEELFMKGVLEAVKANMEYVPPYGLGASLYIRPLLIGMGENLGVHPAPEYLFLVFVSPVGPYFKEGFKPISLKVEDHYDRAAPNGIGNVKAGGNYSAALLPLKKAQAAGFNENVYLDAKEHKYFEEVGAANVFFHFKDGTLATPKSSAILPSITRRSVMEVAADEYGIETIERKVGVDEIENIVEAGACGTAAVITPIGSMGYNNQIYKFYAQGKEPGPVCTKLYNYLTSLQLNDIEDKKGWLTEVIK